MTQAELLRRIEQAARENVTRLDLSREELTDLPPQIGQLTELTHLVLKDNTLDELPPEIGQLANLAKLDLSGNYLSDLPAEIGQLANLAKLDLSDNELSELPPEIGQLSRLTELVLSDNELAKLPPKIGQLKKLTQLVLSGNYLSDLPAEIGQLTNLEELNLSDSGLSSLPPEIDQLTNLEELDLSDNGLSSLPPEIGQLTNLEELDLSNNGLSSFPPEIGQLANLEELDLSGNKLAGLPPEIGQLTNLTELILSREGLADLPLEIGQLANLTKLVLSGNELSVLPPEIGQLANLTKLVLRGNYLSELPPEIGQLTNLAEVDLSDNELAKLPPEIGQLANLTDLDLSGNGLSVLPPEFGQLKKLTHLILSGNYLSDLPPEAGQLANLMKLILSGNGLLMLPPEIGQLDNLTQLVLRDNKLSALPAEIGRLANLTKLDLRGNELSELPPEIGQLATLTQLVLRGNGLAVLPPEIGQLANLAELDLSDNELTELAPEIGQLTNLTKLILYDNGLAALPPEIEQLVNLTQLDLEANRLPIPLEIQEKKDEPDILINYYLQHATGQKRPLNEAKILLVGQTTVGKTSLVRRLMGGPFNPRETMTAGIDIEQWPVIVDRQYIRLNVWDFGGQEIMHATHKFFLTKRSLYLLVLDARLDDEANRAEYWLKIIQSYAGDSPTIIVGNKVDQQHLHLDRREFMSKYKNIRAIVETSCETGDGIDELRTLIEREVGALDHVHDELPAAWFKVKKQLEDMSENYISQDRYRYICQAEGISDPQDQRTLLGFLHDLGIVLSFQDDSLLEETNILNPKWVTNGVYKILNNRLLFENKGVLERSMLKQILDPQEYPPEMQLFIMELMHKFELCFHFAGLPNKRFLIPDVSPKEEPYTGEWQGALDFQYHYNVLPGSIISRFIVSMRSYIHQSTSWRTGVVLAYKSNTALVKADQEDHKISIQIVGPEPGRRLFLDIIRLHFDPIHKSFPDLAVTEKVSLGPGTAVELDYLKKLHDRGRETFLPQGMQEDVLVEQVLAGIESGPESLEQQENLTEEDDPDLQPTPPLAEPVEAKNAETLTQREKLIIDRLSEKQTKSRLWVYLGILVAIWIVFGISIYIYADALDLWIPFIVGIFTFLITTLIPYVYFAYTKKKLSPEAIFEQLVASKKRKNYLDAGLDVKEVESLLRK